MNDKPRVAYLLQMFGIGGMPKWLYQVAKGLRDRYDFFFIATHSEYVVEAYRDVAQIDVVSPNKWAIAHYLFTHRIDIAQVANLRLYTEAAILARVPVIVERTDGLRGGAALQSKEGQDAVVASAAGLVPHLENLIDPQRIHVIYNGTDLEAYDQIQSQRFDFAPDDVIIGRTSRLAEGKNISLLIRAVIELRKDPRYQQVRLVICGGDNTQPGAVPMLARLKREAEPLGSSAIFTGEVFEVDSITKGYDIVTCTSRPNNEGIPNSLIEGMAAGKPVVASAVDNIPEVVENGVNGLLFSPNDQDALVAALRKLIDQPALREKMGQANRRRIEVHFNLPTQVAKYAALYDQLLTVKGRHVLHRLFGKAL